MLKRFIIPGVMAAALVAAQPASAQTQSGPRQRPERPYRGLFGGGYGDSAQSLTGSLSLGGGYTGNLLATASGTEGSGGSVTPRGGASRFGSASGSLQYRFESDAIRFETGAGTSGRYFSQATAQNWVATSSANVALTWQASDKTQVSLGSEAQNQPYNLFPRSAQVPIIGPDLASPPVSLETALIHIDYLNWTSDASVMHQMTRRLSLSGGYQYRWNNLDALGGDNQMGRGLLTWTLTKNLNARLGYGRTVATYKTTGTRSTSHNIDAGLAFSKALSLTRRTTLSFQTGSTVTAWKGSNHFSFTGGASLNREIGRSWNAIATYDRSVQFVAAFQQPSPTDAFTFGLGGLLGRRFQAQTGVTSYYRTVGFDAGDNGALATAATASLRTAITRFFSVDLNYAYYRHSVGVDVFLLPGVARDSRYQTVSVQVSMLAPLMNRSRRPNAAR